MFRNLFFLPEVARFVQGQQPLLGSLLSLIQRLR